MCKNNSNKKDRIQRLEEMKSMLLSRYSKDHFAIKALENRIMKIKLLWWIGV